MREDLISRWPQVRAFLWGVLLAGVLGVVLFVGAGQRASHRAAQHAIRTADIAWEICRAAEGMPAKHDKGGGWIRDTFAELPESADVFDEWVWTDAAGKFTHWPGHEDNSANEDDDVCSTAWRAGYSAATEEGR